VADRDLAEAEIDYLDALMEALGLEEKEAREVFEAARQHSGLLTLEEKTVKMKSMMPRFVDCMALMAAADGEVHHEERLGIRAVLRNIPDMAVLTGDELDAAIEEAIGRVAKEDQGQLLGSIAQTIAQPADRYWTTVYMMIVALADGKSDWREVAFLESCKKTFELSDYQMDVAMDTARQFPLVELGGSAPA
jgi:tellurite resistance protein